MIVLSDVVIANFFPKKIKPITNNKVLIIVMMYSSLISKNGLNNTAMPATPPDSIWLGKIKAETAKAKMKFPIIINPISLINLLIR